MLALRIELAVTCATCQAAVALNAIAPHVACDRCGRHIALSADRWRELLSAPLAELASMADGEQREAHRETPEGVCRCVYRREAPRCVACGDAAPPERVIGAAAPSGWVDCARCRRRMLARALPSVAPSVACFFGEEAELAFEQGPRAREAVVVACPSCGASLPADGSARAVACAFCRATVHLPDEVWARLHPTRPVQPFWALSGEVAARPTSDAAFGAVHAGAVDAAGNLYLAADDALYSLDADLRLRWVRADVHVDHRALVLYPDGRLWARGRVSPVLLACDDGRTLGPGPSFPASPMGGALEAYAAQGASVLSSRHMGASFRVERHGLDGAPLPLFPKAGLIAGLLGGGGAALEKPHGLNAAAGLDGDVFILSDKDFRVTLEAHGPDGHRKWHQDVPVGFSQVLGCRIFATSDGGALVHDPHAGTPGLFHIDARRVQRVLEYERAAVLVGAVVPLATGELLVFGSHGDIVRFAADGSELARNEPAKRLGRAQAAAAQRN